MSELPKRLRHDEDEIQLIKTELKALSSRLDSVTASVEKVLGRLPSLEATALKAEATAENVRNAVQEQAKLARAFELPAAETKLEDRSAVIQARIQELAAQIDEVRIELRKLAPTASHISELSGAIERFSAIQKDLNANKEGQDERARELSSAIEEVQRSVEKLQRNVAALTEDRHLAVQLSALVGRVAELEQRSNVVAPSPQLADKTKSLTTYQSGKVLDLHAGLNWESLQPVNGNGVVLIGSHSDLANAFLKALQPLGLRKTAGRIFAEECAAAVVSRQAIFLKGAFATRVARGLARAIGGPASARLAIPIGVQDGEELRFCVGAALGPHKDFVGALAIEGINRTALDVTKEVLADCVDPPNATRDRWPQRLALFATIAVGIASLPIEPGYFELGPVFDLDYLDWRTNQAADPEPAGSRLPIDASPAWDGGC